MKKNSFMEGATIATIAIVLCKVIGILYVIPFYSIIGQDGAILYSYSYSIYGIFLSLSSSGIPIAMSKIISEYNTLGYHYTKQKSYRIGRNIIVFLGVLSFLVLFIFAKDIAHLMLGNLEGNITIKDVAFTIRIVSTAILIVPILSVTKGYLQGHKFITAPSIANVLEQLARAIVIVIGSYLSLKVFNLSLTTGVGVAVFGATAGALVAYFYIFTKLMKSKNELNSKAIITREERKFDTKYIIKQIILYALPFILIDVMKQASNMVDTVTVVKTLKTLGYTELQAGTAFSVVSTWGTKLNMIVVSISVGLTISLIPNITSSYVKRDLADVRKKINQTLQILLITTLPLAIGVSLVARPLWIVFYGYNALAIHLFQFSILASITFVFYSVCITILQTLNNTKAVMFNLIICFILVATFNIPMMHFCKWIGFEGYFGSVVSSMISQIVPTTLMLIIMKRKYSVDYKDTINKCFKILLACLIMMLSVLILKSFMPTSTSRLLCLLEVLFYGVIGGSVYLLIIFRTKIIYDVFGYNFINKITNKLPFKKLKKE